MPSYSITDAGGYSQILHDRDTGPNEFVYQSIPKTPTRIEVKKGVLSIFYFDNTIKIPRADIAVPASANDLDLYNNLQFMVEGAAGGSVTQVNTGTGLQGGPITTSGTISIADTGVSDSE